MVNKANSSDQFKHFTRRLISQVGSQIVSMVEFGSGKAREYPDLSDFDLLIVAKQAQYISSIRKASQELEQQIFGIKDSSLVGFLEKHLFLKPKFTGVHLVVVSQAEFDPEFNPKSWRLKLAGLIFGQHFFLNDLKKRGRVLFGQDLIKQITPLKMGWFDLVMVYLKLGAVLISAPIISDSELTFKLRCFKVLRHLEQVLAYFPAQSPKLPVIQQLTEYRFKPRQYPESNFILYLKTWTILTGINFNLEITLNFLKTYF